MVYFTIGYVVLVVLCLLFIYGGNMTKDPHEDDEQQIEYLRKWNEKKT